VCQNAAFLFLLHSLELIEFVGHFFRDGFARCVFLCAANPTFFPILLSDKNHEKDTLEDHEKITNHFFDPSFGWIFSVFRFFVVSLKTADLFDRIINTISSQSIHSVLVVHNEYGRRYKR
jgi:hypothetical protein